MNNSIALIKQKIATDNGFIDWNEAKTDERCIDQLVEYIALNTVSETVVPVYNRITKNSCKDFGISYLKTLGLCQQS